MDTAPALTPQPHAGGTLYVLRLDDVPDGFYQYKYVVTFENGSLRWCGDPCTRWLSTEAENAAFVVSGATTTVPPLAARLPLSDLVIYELMIDDFTAAYRGSRAPVDAVVDRLDDLVDLGINAVEFMPWRPGAGGASPGATTPTPPSRRRTATSPTRPIRSTGWSGSSAWSLHATSAGCTS